MRMLTIEQKTIRKACKAENFLDVVDTLYEHRGSFGDKYIDSVSQVLAVAGDVIDWQFPTALHVWECHTKDSQRRLLDLSGSCVPSALSSSVDAELETWPARIDETINQLFPEGEKP